MTPTGDALASTLSQLVSELQPRDGGGSEADLAEVASTTPSTWSTVGPCRH
jgi:hypothetical protein